MHHRLKGHPVGVHQQVTLAPSDPLPASQPIASPLLLLLADWGIDDGSNGSITVHFVSVSGGTSHTSIESRRSTQAVTISRSRSSACWVISTRNRSGCGSRSRVSWSVFSLAARAGYHGDPLNLGRGREVGGWLVITTWVAGLLCVSR